MKTAVELFVQELFNNGYFHYGIPEDMVNEAKEMEKQQIIEAYASGVLNECSGANIRSEQYYNEYYNNTFKTHDK